MLSYLCVLLCLLVWPSGRPGRLEGLQGPMVAGCMLSVYGLFSSCDREQFLMSAINQRKGAAKTAKSNICLQEVQDIPRVSERR